MATLDPHPPKLAALLAEFPSPGERNLWFFRVAVAGRRTISPRRMENFLLQVVAAQGWKDRNFTREIRRAIRRAYNNSPDGSCDTVPAFSSPQTPRWKYPPWPPVDEKVRGPMSQGRHGFTLDPLKIDPAEVLDRLYPKDALLCLATSKTDARTAPREQWRGKEAEFQFIVANPMTALTGLNQDGQESTRCHGNATKNRTYQVIEFDHDTLDTQVTILTNLHSERTPLVLVVNSGGKSLHGWFDVRLLDEAQKREFFAQACRCGADDTLWDQCKLVRMPGGLRRANCQRQSILFFDPRHHITRPRLPQGFGDTSAEPSYEPSDSTSNTENTPRTT